MNNPIPVVDLQVATRSTAPAHLLAAVKTATESCGVVQVVNHGVPGHLINDLGRGFARLFGLPRPRKAALVSPTGHPFRGWRQWPDDFGRLELERFGVGQFDNVAHARAEGLADAYLALYAHANVWPEDDPRLHFTAFRYLSAASEVAERVLGLYARAQGLPADTFPVGGLPHLSLTVSRYPAWDGAESGDGDCDQADDGQGGEGDDTRVLLAERADASAVTVIAQNGGFGPLQVRLPGGGWASAEAIPGALLVFSGTLLARWTNGRLRAARHRVVAGGAAARSATVSYSPPLEAVVEPLSPFLQPGEIADGGPVTVRGLELPAAS